MSESRRLLIVLALNLALVVGLAVVGFAAGSVSLLAAAGDSAADAFALGLGLIAVRMRDRHGRVGATNVVALVNVLVLLVVAAAVLVEAVVRLLAGAPPVAAVGVLIAGLATAVVLGSGAVIIASGTRRGDLHMRSVLLDTAFDGLAALGVAAAGLVMTIAHGLYWLDPAVAGVIALVVGVGAGRLLRDVVVAIRLGRAVEVDRD